MPIIYESKGRAKEYSLLAANLYTGCQHGCHYCYAHKMAVQYGRNFDNPEVRPNLISELKKDALRYAGTDKRVLLCFSCDPYQQIDRTERMTRASLQILREYNINFQILTKGGLEATRDFDLYGSNDAFATTLTFVDQEQSLHAEPEAATPSQRIKAIQQAHDAGIETWVSLEPVIDPEQSLELISLTHEFVDLYKIGKLNHEHSDIDWRSFGIRALSLCQEYRKPYYIKNDLAQFMQGIDFQNTDTRIVSQVKAGELLWQQ